MKSHVETMFKASAVMWFAAGAGMAFSAWCFALWIVFAVLHAVLLVLTLVNAVKLQHEIWREEPSKDRPE